MQDSKHILVWYLKNHLILIPPKKIQVVFRHFFWFWTSIIYSHVFQDKLREVTYPTNGRKDWKLIGPICDQELEKSEKNPATSKQQKLHPCESFFKHLPHVEVPDSCDLEAWKLAVSMTDRGNFAFQVGELGRSKRWLERRATRIHWTWKKGVFHESYESKLSKLQVLNRPKSYDTQRMFSQVLMLHGTQGCDSLLKYNYTITWIWANHIP